MKIEEDDLMGLLNEMAVSMRETRELVKLLVDAQEAHAKLAEKALGTHRDLQELRERVEKLERNQGG